MEADLTRDSRRILEALVRLGSSAEGLLFGHTRGPRRIVEHVLAFPPDADPGAEDLIEIDRIFGGGLIGWFAIGESTRPEQRALQPYMTGKLFLRIRPGGDRGPVVEPFVVEFRQGFVLAPIEMHSSENTG